MSKSSNPRINLPLVERHISALLLRQAQHRGDAPFLTVSGTMYTFREVQQRVLRVAAGFTSAGIAEGDRIGVMLANCAEFVFVWFAAAHVGAAAVVMNPQFRGSVLDTALADCDCRALVLHADALTRASSQLESLQSSGVTCVVVGEHSARSGLVAFSDFQASEQALAPAHAGDWQTIQTISFTSGSTGPSKGVRITNSQAVDTACTFVHAMNLAPEDVVFSPFALFHGMSNRLAVLPCLVVGAHVVLAERFSASAFWQQAAACGATVAQTLPTVTALLKSQLPGERDRAHSVTRMYNSRVDEEFERRFGVTLVEAYGMTEFGVVIYTPYPERRAGACGRIHPGWEVRIVDEMDFPVPTGMAGELVFRPKEPGLLCDGYMARPQATVDATRNLWFHTGDMALEDADGYIHFLDRKKDRIRRRGENISSFDAEFIVCGHPGVLECAVLPHPATLGEDDIRLIVVVKSGTQLKADELFSWLQIRMPRFMLPRFIEFTDTLPRTHNNKIEKFKLAALGLGATAWDSEAL